MNEDVMEIVKPIVHGVGKRLGIEVKWMETGEAGEPEVLIGRSITIARAKVEKKVVKIGHKRATTTEVPGYYVFAIQTYPGNRDEPPGEEPVDIYIGDRPDVAVRKAFEAYVNEVIDNEFEHQSNEAEAKHYAEEEVAESYDTTPIKKMSKKDRAAMQELIDGASKLPNYRY